MSGNGDTMKYPIAEKFVSPQGEGLHTGVVMAFIRLVGCSVGQKICTHCDTDFDKVYERLGGGLFTVEELKEWVLASKVHHVCLTGGEPLDRDLRPLLQGLTSNTTMCHVETSGTKHPDWLDKTVNVNRPSGSHEIRIDDNEPECWAPFPVWVTVSPKPGYLSSMIRACDEIKLIVGGLGDGPGWPTVTDAIWWSEQNTKPVYIQPRNERLTINRGNMDEVIELAKNNPTLRVSLQAHKWLNVR